MRLNLLREQSRRTELLVAIFLTLSSVAVWFPPTEARLRFLAASHIAAWHRARNIERTLAQFSRDPKPGTVLTLPAQHDVVGKPLPRGRHWVLVSGPLSKCSVPLLVEWNRFALRQRQHVIVCTTSSAVVAKFFQEQYHLSNLSLVSDPLIAERAEWNVFIYPRLYLRHSDGRLLWACRMPSATPKSIPDEYLGGTAK